MDQHGGRRGVRLNKHSVIGGSVALMGAGFVALGGLVYNLQQELVSARVDLVAARDDLTDLRELTEQQRAELTNLEHRLGDVGRELVDVKHLEAEARTRLLAEIEARTGTTKEAMREELSGLEARVAALRAAADEHARLLAAARANEDVELRYRELMSPTVRVNARHEVGSGTIVWSQPSGNRARTYILTAWHIVADNVGPDGPVPLEVDFYDNGTLLRTERGAIVAQNEPLDLALLEVRGYHVYERVARLPTPAQLRELPIFSRVYAIGCPLGYSPLPTSGELTSKHKELDGNAYWMINAPTIFGNSGGGIYDARSRTLIGVLSRISAYKNMIDVAVPHMGLVMPLDRVYRWLDSTRYPFVYRDRIGRPSEEAGHEKAQDSKALPASADGKPKQD